MIFHSLKLGGLYKPNRRDNMSLKLTLSNKKTNYTMKAWQICQVVISPKGDNDQQTLSEKNKYI